MSKLHVLQRQWLYFLKFHFWTKISEIVGNTYYKLESNINTQDKNHTNTIQKLKKDKELKNTIKKLADQLDRLCLIVEEVKNQKIEIEKKVIIMNKK